MADILVTSVPIQGHVLPLLAVAQGLVARGHRVRFLTGQRFADSVEATGATHVSLPAAADFDDRTLRSEPSDGRGASLSGLQQDLQRVFLAPAAAQYEAVLELLREPTDVVLTEPGFVGAALLSKLPRAERPSVVGVGVIPLPLSSADVAPYGLGVPPLRGPLNHVRNRALQLLAERVLFRPVQRALRDLTRDVLGEPVHFFVFDGLRMVDAIVQLTVPSFEYPRRDLGVPLYFSGPIIRASSGPVPTWWPDLEQETRRVVLVTQGTLANLDMTELIRPTLDALADDPDLLVVVTTGGRPVADLGPIPVNARAAEFLPYDRLCPLIDVMVTNGGYGGVHYALLHGVPVVVAGVSEEKPEVAARVAWSGAGVRLKTARPTATQVRHAVEEVLTTTTYADAARRLRDEIAASRGLDEFESVIAAVT